MVINVNQKNAFDFLYFGVWYILRRGKVLQVELFIGMINRVSRQ